jgi:uncharacterized membrane protein (DUF373 family)
MGLLRIVKRIERVLVIALVAMMAVVLLLATIDVGWMVWKTVLTPPRLVVSTEQLTEIFGAFMLVVVGIELLETISRTVLVGDVARVEIVLLVALVALARKVILLDTKAMSGASLAGLAALLVALAGGFFLLRRSEPNGSADAEGSGGPAVEPEKPPPAPRDG